MIKDKDGLVTVDTLDSAKNQVKEVEKKEEQVIDVKPEIEVKDVKGLPEATEETVAETTPEATEETVAETTPEATKDIKPE